MLFCIFKRFDEKILIFSHGSAGCATQPSSSMRICNPVVCYTLQMLLFLTHCFRNLVNFKMQSSQITTLLKKLVVFLVVLLF